MFLGLVDLVMLKPRAEVLLLGDQLVHLGENVGIVVRVRGHGLSLPDYGVSRGH